MYEAAQKLGELSVRLLLPSCWDTDSYCLYSSLSMYAGKYLTIPRTEGISTTHIVGRILNHIKCSTAGSSATPTATATDSPGATKSSHDLRSGGALSTYLHGKSDFLTTARMLRLFSASVKVHFLRAVKCHRYL